MSAETQIKLQVDRIAKGVENSLSNFATGDDFWTLVDAAVDETYENRLKGSIMTALDTALSTNPFGNLTDFRNWFNYHNTYFSTDLGLTLNPLWEAYLATKGWRVPYSFELMIESVLGIGSAIGNEYVFPKGTRPANEATPVGSLMHKFGSWTASGATAGAWTAADGSLGEVITRRVRGSVIVAINTTAGTSTSGSNYTLKCYKQVPGETPETVFITPAVATFNGVARYTQVIVGKQAITLVGTPGATTTDLTVAVSSQFTIGDYVLLVNSDNSIQEVTLVTAKPSGKITVNNTVNTIADTWFAIPMFRNAEIVSCASSAASQVIELFAYPDRAITL